MINLSYFGMVLETLVVAFAGDTGVSHFFLSISDLTSFTPLTTISVRVVSSDSAHSCNNSASSFDNLNPILMLLGLSFGGLPVLGDT